jgi:predicted peptidase
MRYALITSLVILLMTSEMGLAQGSEAFLQRTLTGKVTRNISLRYLIHIPNDYNVTGRRFPLLLYLHGGKGRGDDFKKLSWYPVPKMIVEHSLPDSFVVIIPQCPSGQLWPEQTDGLISLIDETTSQYRIDTARIYGMGYSMGGNGIANVAYARPDLFAALVLMSSIYNPWWVTRLKKIPAWYFHGAKDDRVSVYEADRMVEEYKREGAEPRYSRDPESGHRPPSEEEHIMILRWLLMHSRDGLRSQ